MAGIERRHPARRTRTGAGAKPTERKARNRSESRSYASEALALMKGVSSRIFSVRTEQGSASSSERRSARRVRSDSFVRSRSSRTNAGLPPVLVRRGLQDMATPKRGLHSPRKRRDVALNVPGAEVRLTSLPSVRFGWRLLSGLIFVMMAASGYLLLNMPTFQVDLVEVKGLERLTLADLDQALGITGESVVTLDAGEIRQTLLSLFHGIQDVRVEVGLPASVQVTVQERQPVMSWVFQGETRWVDEAGIVFEPGSDAAQLPVTVQAEVLPLLPLPDAAGTEEPSALQYERFDPVLVHVVQAMLAYLPAEAQLVFDDNHGFGWTDQRGWQVYFGLSTDEIDQKLLVYQSIIQQVDAKGIQPSLISVEFLHAPFYRLER